MVTLTTRSKNWLAINAGIDNCFAPAGVAYTDPDGFPHVESTDRVVNAFYVAHQLGLETAKIIANTDYIGFTAINNNVDIDMEDIDWAYNSSNHQPPEVPSTLPQYCAPPAHMVPTELLVNSACAPDPCTVDATITWMNDGALPGSLIPGVVVDSGPPTTIPSEILFAGATATHTFTISGLTIAGNPHTVCTYGQSLGVPALCQNVTVFTTLDICNWILSVGGWTAVRAYHIMLLVDAYLLHISLGYTVRMQDINGAIAYYLGFLDSGNMFTGCVFT